MDPFQIGKTYYARFTFLRKQYRFTLKTSNLKVANQICEQIHRGLDKGIFDSFEPEQEGEKILRLLIARPGLRAEEAQQELNATTHRARFKEAVERYLENCKTEHAVNNYKNGVRTFKDFSEFVKVIYVHQVTADTIEKWRNGRIEQVSKATVNRELKMSQSHF